MKAMKKVLAFVLALAMVVTAVPVTDAAAKTVKLSAGTTKSKTFYTGKTHTLKLNGVTKADVKSTTWTSNKPAVVKVVAGSETKVSAKIKCVKKGTATVTAKVTLKNGNTKTYKAKITVKAPTLTVSPSEMSLTVGETQAITAKKTPSGATLKYSSSDPGVATVSGKKITAKSAGKAVITVQLVNGTKKITKKIDVTVSAAQDGLSVLNLTNPISSEYPNTVWVSDNAVVNVQYVRDGKPVAGESLVLTEKSTSSFPYQNQWNSAMASTKVAVTNANGIATFVIGFNDSRIKATDDSYVGTYDYTISTANGSATTDGQVAFAAIVLGKVSLQNKLPDGVRPSDINPLAVSTNTTGNGYTTTKATATRKVNNGQIVVGSDVDYVDSQQVSVIGTTAHQVAFESYLPQIKLPKSGSDISSAVRYQQDVNISSGNYSVYVNDSKTIALNVNPSELTYATLNFSKIQLSQYTKLVIETYGNKGCTGSPLHSYEVTGEADMLVNGYQIPLDERYGEMGIKLTLVSQGQVNTDKNAGYEVKDITGVYKTTSGGYTTTVALKGAKVEWAVTTAPMSNVKNLTTTESDAIGAVVKTDAGNKKLLEEYNKVTYQVPVFPYTGNAVLTCYDTNGNVKAYYVCPTVNSAQVTANAGVANNTYNENVLDTTKCYEVSKDEAFNQVGTIVSQDDSRVIVNSEKVGVTSLKGTVTIDGMEVSALDATNDTLYTSVQWCPVPETTVDDSVDEWALIGQKVTVTAQLVDLNNNPVTIAGQDIEFYENWNGSKLVTGGSAGYTTLSTWNSNKVVTVLSADTKTNSLGQANLVLQSSEISHVPGLYAKESSGKYKVILSLKNGDKPAKANIKWADVDLAFTDTAVGTATTVEANQATPYVSTSDMGLAIQPKTGTNWDYGIYAKFNKDSMTWLPNIVISGLGIGMSKDVASVGTVSFPTDKSGVASATSNKAGAMNISGILDSSSDVSNVTFSYWGQTKKIVGEGAPALNKKLTLNVVWQANGVAITAVNANGINAAVVSGSAVKTVYVKVSDKNGSPLAGKDVVFTVNNPTKASLAEVTLGGATGQSEITVQTDEYGIAKVNVNLDDTSLITSTVTAYVNKGTTDQQEVAQTIRWIKNATAFELNLAKGDDGSYLTSVKNGKIVLTFTDNVVANSVVKEMFTVATRDRNYEVTSYTISGNSIVLTVRNLPTDLAASEDITVSIAQSEVDGVTYILTSDKGLAFADTDVVVHDGTTVPPALAE